MPYRLIPYGKNASELVEQTIHVDGLCFGRNEYIFHDVLSVEDKLLNYNHARIKFDDDERCWMHSNYDSDVVYCDGARLIQQPTLLVPGSVIHFTCTNQKWYQYLVVQYTPELDIGNKPCEVELRQELREYMRSKDKASVTAIRQKLSLLKKRKCNF